MSCGTTHSSTTKQAGLSAAGTVALREDPTRCFEYDAKGRRIVAVVGQDSYKIEYDEKGRVTRLLHNDSPALTWKWTDLEKRRFDVQNGGARQVL